MPPLYLFALRGDMVLKSKALQHVSIDKIESVYLDIHPSTSIFVMPMTFVSLSLQYRVIGSSG